MGLELAQGYNKEKRDTGHHAPGDYSMPQNTISLDYLAGKTDTLTEKVNDISHKLDQLQAQHSASAEVLSACQKGTEDTKYQIADRMNAVTKAACHYTSDLIDDLEASMDVFATQQSVKSLHRIVTAVCAITIFNMACTLLILLRVFGIL